MIPVQTVDVTPARDDDVSCSSSLTFDIIEMTLQRYGIVPPTEAERAAAMAMAMGDATGNEVSGVAQGGAAARMTRTAQGTNPAAGIAGCQDTLTSILLEEPSHEIGCCGFYAHFGRRRST
jgi:hypothetical protein